jgi:hypothetical protein
MYWYRQPNDAILLSIDAMTACNAQKKPAVTLDGADELLSGNRLQTAISKTCADPCIFESGKSTER